jgi:hypothetical protein
MSDIRVIEKNETDADRRTVNIFARAVADGKAHTAYTGKASIVMDDAAATPTTADVTHVANGRYKVVLTQSEVDQDVGASLSVELPYNDDYICQPASIQIVKAGTLSPPTALEIATEIVIQEIAALDGYDAQAGTITIGGVTIYVTRGNLKPILTASLTPP